MWGLLGTAEPVGLFVGARVQPSGWGFTAADGRGSAGARQGLLAKGLQGSVFTHKEKGGESHIFESVKCQILSERQKKDS